MSYTTCGADSKRLRPGFLATVPAVVEVLRSIRHCLPDALVAGNGVPVTRLPEDTVFPPPAARSHGPRALEPALGPRLRSGRLICLEETLASAFVAKILRPQDIGFLLTSPALVARS